MPKKPTTSSEDHRLFQKAMKDVTPLNKKHHRNTATSKPSLPAKTRPAPATLDLRLTDTDDTIQSVSSEESLYFARPGPALKTLRHFKQGHFNIEANLDLHGKNIDEARRDLAQFINTCHNQHKRYLLLVHGKGRRAQTDKPVLKNLVNIWLRQIKTVLAFCSAQAKDGGTGAVYILLKANK